MIQPQLQTERLTLRPFELTDAWTVQQLVGMKDVADMTASIPHPYPEGAAEAWIATHQKGFETRSNITFAISLTGTQKLVGCMSLFSFSERDSQAELGYWIGLESWNKGYCSEAAARLIQYGFGDLGLHRITAHHMTCNPASGKVLTKVGFKKEGVLRQHIFKLGAYQDIAVFGILRDQFPQGN